MHTAWQAQLHRFGHFGSQEIAAIGLAASSNVFVFRSWRAKVKFVVSVGKHATYETMLNNRSNISFFCPLDLSVKLKNWSQSEIGLRDWTKYSERMRPLIVRWNGSISAVPLDFSSIIRVSVRWVFHKNKALLFVSKPSTTVILNDSECPARNVWGNPVKA